MLRDLLLLVREGRPGIAGKQHHRMQCHGTGEMLEERLLLDGPLRPLL